MSPLSQWVIVVCVVVVSAALTWALVALARTLTRAGAVLEQVEREIRPAATQLNGMVEELRGLSRQAARELERIGTIAKRLEEVVARVATLMAVVTSLTRAGQIAGALGGLRRGLDVFLARLRGGAR